jgi:hypothetical protein
VKLTVNPFYGWGWSWENDANGVNGVPDIFILDAEARTIIDGPDIFLGWFPPSAHPLSGHWLLLTQRHVDKDGHYNLMAYRERPRLPDDLTQKIETPCSVSGFATACEQA